MLTNREVKRILNERKELRGNVQWRSYPSRRGNKLRLEKEVIVPSMGIKLRLIGLIVPGIKMNLTLLYESYPIARLNTGPAHRNPDGTEVHGPHKHLWREEYGDRYAYPVKNISVENPDEAFFEFLKECKIELLGSYSRSLPLF